MTEPNLSVQGNILVGEDVVADIVAAFHATQGELSERLIAALHAGQAAGGDSRGMQSAALLVVRPSDRYPEYRTRYVDLRVEDHVSPIEELERVFRIHQAGDLLRAHVRYGEAFREAGNEEAAQTEFARVGSALEYTLGNESASAGTPNSLAWYLRDRRRLPRGIARRGRASRGVESGGHRSHRYTRRSAVPARSSQRRIATIDRAIALSPDDPYLVSHKERFEKAR